MPKKRKSFIFKISPEKFREIAARTREIAYEQTIEHCKRAFPYLTESEIENAGRNSVTYRRKGYFAFNDILRYVLRKKGYQTNDGLDALIHS